MRQSTPEGERLADVLRQLRAEAGITQEEMAERVGLTYAGYRPYEQGRRELKPSQLPRFAAALDKSTAVLAERIGLLPESVHSLRVTELSELVGEVETEAPHLADELMEMFRLAQRIALRRQHHKRSPPL